MNHSPRVASTILSRRFLHFFLHSIKQAAGRRVNVNPQGSHDEPNLLAAGGHGVAPGLQSKAVNERRVTTTEKDAHCVAMM